MTEHQLKIRVGWLIIILNLVTLGIVAACFVLRGFDEDEATTVAAIIVPMFMCYTVAAINHIFKERFIQEDRTRLVTAAAAYLAFGIPIAFAVTIAGMMLLQAQGQTFSNFESFKTRLLFVETIFAGIMGATIYPIFPEAERRRESRSHR